MNRIRVCPPKDGTCLRLIMPTSNTAFQVFLDVLARKFAWVSTAPPTTEAATLASNGRRKHPPEGECWGCLVALTVDCSRRKSSPSSTIRSNAHMDPRRAVVRGSRRTPQVRSGRDDRLRVDQTGGVPADFLINCLTISALAWRNNHARPSKQFCNVRLDVPMAFAGASLKLLLA